MYEYVYWKYKNGENVYECPYTFFNRMLIFILEIYLLNDSFLFHWKLFHDDF